MNCPSCRTPAAYDAAFCLTCSYPLIAAASSGGNSAPSPAASLSDLSSDEQPQRTHSYSYTAATRHAHSSSGGSLEELLGTRQRSPSEGALLEHGGSGGSGGSEPTLIHGVVPRSVCEKVLLEHGVGTFLVRGKSTGQGLTLSVRDVRAVYHYIVESNRSDDFCLMSLAQLAPHFDSLESLLAYYHQHPIKDCCLTSTVDLFAIYKEMQATRTQCASMYSHAIEACVNLSEALELEHDIHEAAKLAELADDAYKDLLQRLGRVKTKYLHGIPTSAWTPDTGNTTCMCCQNVKFGPLKRRHHCRNCGQLICSACVRSGVLHPSVQMDKLCKVCHGFFVRTLNTPDEHHMSATKAKRLSLTGAGQHAALKAGESTAAQSEVPRLATRLDRTLSAATNDSHSSSSPPNSASSPTLSQARRLQAAA